MTESSPRLIFFPFCKLILRMARLQPTGFYSGLDLLRYQLLVEVEVSREPMLVNGIRQDDDWRAEMVMVE